MSSVFRRVLLGCLVIVLTLGSGALGETREFSPKELQRFNRLLSRNLKVPLRNIRKEGRELEKRFEKLRKDIVKGEVAEEDRSFEVASVCSAFDRFENPISTTSTLAGQFEVDDDSESARVAIVNAASSAISDGGLVFLSAVRSLGAGFNEQIADRLRFERSDQLRRLRLEKSRLEKLIAALEGKPEEAKVEFHRGIENHVVDDPNGGDPLIFRRPGIERLKVTESGDVEIELSTAFPEPESFVRIQLTRPDGSVIFTKDVQQQDSTKTESRSLAFDFQLTTLPEPNEAVLLVIASSFSESLLDLLDPFDCFGFRFPSSTPSSN